MPASNFSTSSALIWILDDEPEVAASLVWLLQTVNLNAKSLARPQDLDFSSLDKQPGCLLLDVRLPLISGFEVLEQIQQQKCLIPVIMMSGHADVSMAVRAMKLGASDFFAKPFNDQQLLDSILAALPKHTQALQERQQQEQFQQNLASLTQREEQIMQLLLAGQAVKQIAAALNISPKTVDVHRFNLLQKMQASSTIELIHLAYAAKIAIHN